jgi:hypothetical protein
MTYEFALYCFVSVLYEFVLYCFVSVIYEYAGSSGFIDFLQTPFAGDGSDVRQSRSQASR